MGLNIGDINVKGVKLGSIDVTAIYLGDVRVYPNAIVVAKYNVTSTSSPTRIGTSGFSAIEIDGVVQPSVVSAYTFSTTGYHTVKYTLKDPTSIGTYAFYNCTNLTSIVIPDSVTSIDYQVFQNCSAMTTCTIGSGVTSIGNNAFRGCTSLTSIVSNATTAPTIQSSTFQNVKTGGTLTVPSGSSGYDVWMGTSNYYLGLYNWTKVELPSGYKICEYIGNQGAAYIDTNITLDFTEDIEIKYSVLSYSNAYGSILGYYSGETMNTTRIIQNNGNSNSVLIYYNSKANGGSVAANVNPLGEINVIKLTPTEYVVNGTTVTKNATQGTAYNAPLKIFTSSRVYSDCRIYSFSISGKCNMIPCISPNSVVGMYDTVRNQFFSSANSTDLVAGPIIGEV